ncbi:MAG TPA: hypothetical protein PLI95_03405 [Polyangiaceae bacterium]|nr:hypothetical protein [Polyangiaceae bacterium]
MVNLLTREYPPLSIPLGHTVILKGLDLVEQRMIKIDDMNVGIIIDPAPGQRVRLVEARVDFWLTDEDEDEDPTEFLAVPTDGSRWEYIAAFPLALRFGRADE